jgi:hypothetical protein
LGVGGAQADEGEQEEEPPPTPPKEGSFYVCGFYFCFHFNLGLIVNG